MIKKLNLKNYRSHESLQIEFNNNICYIHGNNGIGKTSILESIHLISTSRSHRQTNDLDLIMHDKPFLHVKLKTEKNLYEMIISKKGKLAVIDKKEVNKISDFIGRLKVVMFAPEDLNLIKGTPSDRRRFIDLELIKLNTNYLNNLNNYYRILKQRNSLLKNINIGDDETFLNILSEQLLKCANEINIVRQEYFDELNIYFNKHFQTFSNHNVFLKLEQNANYEQLKKHLFNNQKQDIILKTTSQGPHRDDFSFVFDGFNAKAYASQGQGRLMVVALKLALLDVIKNKTNDDVILLLDDVLSEFDERITNIFLEKLPKDHQIIMTSTQNINIENMQIINLDRGVINESK